MTMEETKKKEDQKKSSIKINPTELVYQSVWNAVTWLPAMLLSSFIDSDQKLNLAPNFFAIDFGVTK